ncbi:MAG: FixH family protein [Kofleriaceae bacterium]|nr:FixH family protein [Kofleriaceae bacterium]
MRPALLALGLGFLGACGADDGGGDDEPVDCSTVTGTDVFHVDLEKPGTSGMLDYTMKSATPAPPARGDNSWVFQISTMSSGVVGTPLDGATLQVTPFMPSHQHGSPIKVEVTPMSEPGTYKLEPVNLWMPGVWETTIRATSGTTSDSVVYKFCIE